MIDLSSQSILVVGFARTGQAVAEVVVGRSKVVYVIDDRPSEDAFGVAQRIGVDLIVAPGIERLRLLCDSADLVVVSPGVPPSHSIFTLCDRSKFVSEIELAYLLTSTPIVAITGTNGKTTVTTLVAAMLRNSGMRVRAVGNIGDPLIGIVNAQLDTAVVEVSSFQLAYTTHFRPSVGTWLNFSRDHLDWHPNTDDYLKSKARIWAAQGSGDIAIANHDDPVVWSAAQRIASHVVSFGKTKGDYHLDSDRLVGSDGEVVALEGDLRRRFPHDVMNALAAVATARSAGASAENCSEALRTVAPLPHRVELVGVVSGVQYFDDSKATTPSAVVAALESFSSVVLIAGGRNKGLDLEEIPKHIRESGSPQLRGLVVIGEAADEIELAFGRDVIVKRAGSMSDAVIAASELAIAGDVVLLSPGCASFDWYRSYEERGIDFARCVRALHSSQIGTD